MYNKLLRFAAHYGVEVELKEICGYCCGCGWYVIPDTQYTLTRKQHFSACTLYIAGRLLAALAPRHTH